MADLAPGDAPEGHVTPEWSEDESWAEAQALAATVEDHELLDPGLSSEDLALSFVPRARGRGLPCPAPARILPLLG